MKKLKLNGSMKTYQTFWNQHPKRYPFHYRGLECKSRKSETPGVTGKFGLGAQNEAEQRKIREHTGHSKQPLQQQKRRLYTRTSPNVNIKIRLIAFFEAKYGEALNSQLKQDWELTVAQIMNVLLQNSDIN